MLRSVIIDDEQAAIGALSKKLELYCKNIDVIATCNRAKEGIETILKHKPDLVFLDIEMPWMNGFELLQSFGANIDFKVVFVTAYDQYAVKAFKVKAQDYLLKPVDKDDLIRCVNSISEKHKIQNQDHDKLKSLLTDIYKPIHSDKLILHSKESIDIIKKSDIQYIKAESNYSKVFAQNNNGLITTKTLMDLEQYLDPNQYMRVHRSYIVNLNYVSKLETTDGIIIKLSNGADIPVSRRKKDEVLKAIIEK